MLSEEAKMMAEEKEHEVLTANNKIPYALLSREMEGSAKELQDELTEICKYYSIYRKGARFNIEGTNSDYVGANLKFKMAALLIKKEARFLFAEPPDIVIEPKGDLGKVTDSIKDGITVMNDLLKTVLDKNMFEDELLKAAKDCFVGKRVAGLVNFNEEDGVTVSFLPSTNFIYDTKIGNSKVITKFVGFITVKDSISLSDKRIFKKKFELDEDGIVWLEEIMYDGAGKELEVITENQQTLLSTIPAVVFINDGLTGEEDGESEIEVLADYERWYSKLSNGDMDAERKSMNPTKYLVDMESNSTKNLSTAAGAVWDLGSDQNLDTPHPLVGILEPAMNYSASLKTTLDRVKTTAYEEIDMPNVTLESLQGAITSGKGLKAIYWPLIVRCKEKMKMWGPQLRKMVDIIIEGAIAYPNCIKKYTDDEIIPVAYEVSVTQNTPLPEDEAEEKNLDLSEVDSQVMSKKAYMMKWRGLTDEEAMEELQQIALERQIIDDAAFSTSTENNLEDEPPYHDDDNDDDDLDNEV